MKMRKYVLTIKIETTEELPSADELLKGCWLSDEEFPGMWTEKVKEVKKWQLERL